MAKFNVFPNDNGKWTNDNETSSKTLARSGSSLSSLSNSSLHCVKSSASGGSSLESIVSSLKNTANSFGVGEIGSTISDLTGSIGNAFESKINSSIHNKLNSIISKNASKIKINVGDVENMLHLSQGGLTQKLASKVIPYDDITSSINGVLNNAFNSIAGSISSKANVKNISRSVSNAFSSISGSVANGISKRGK